MREELLVLIGQAAAGTQNESVLAEALRISAIGLVAIFVVMGLFALMINLFTRLFPKSEGESES